MNPRYIIGPLILLLVGLQTSRASDILVRIENPPPGGSIAFLFYDDPNTFGDLRDPALIRVEASDGRKEFSIPGVPPGEYALVVYYDENGNGRLDKNFIGIPKEALAFSNAYQPKGPPSYTRAAFRLSDDEVRTFDVELYQALGKRGRIGIGLGAIMRSSPYRDYDGGVYQFIPAITYTGSRLQWFGPRLQLGLAGSGRLRLAATGEYRIGVYKEDGSDYLKGMGDAESTLMAGLALNVELPGGVDLSLGSSADALGRIGGYQASVALDKSFQLGIVRIGPNLAVNWMDEELAAADFGVPAGKATPWRPAYEPGALISLEGGVGLFIEVTTDWLIAANAGVEWLDDDASRSPIVEEQYVIKGFAALNYVF